MTRPADEAVREHGRNASGRSGASHPRRRTAASAEAASVPLLRWLASAGKTNSRDASAVAANGPPLDDESARTSRQETTTAPVLCLIRSRGRWTVADPITRRSIRCRKGATKRDALALWRQTYNQRALQVRILTETQWNQ